MYIIYAVYNIRGSAACVTHAPPVLMTLALCSANRSIVNMQCRRVDDTRTFLAWRWHKT